MNTSWCSIRSSLTSRAATDTCFIIVAVFHDSSIWTRIALEYSIEPSSRPSVVAVSINSSLGCLSSCPRVFHTRIVNSWHEKVSIRAQLIAVSVTSVHAVKLCLSLRISLSCLQPTRSLSWIIVPPLTLFILIA